MKDNPTMNTITTHQNDASRRWIRSWAAALLVAAGLFLLTRAPQVSAATGTLVPALYQTVLDANGNPVAGAKVCTYLAGTSTPAVTYTDVNLTVPNSNPIVADTAGRWAAYLTPGTGYKFILQDATGTAGVCNGAVLRTVDNVAGIPSASIIVTGTWFPSLGGSTTYTVQDGTYVRIGPLVAARGKITVNALGTGSPNQIGGLPFPVAGETAVVIGTYLNLAAPVVTLGGFMADGGTTIGVTGLSAAGATQGFANAFGNGTTVTFGVTYQTAAP
jgi:hypothetical protein